MQANPLNAQAVELLAEHDPAFQPPAQDEANLRAQQLTIKATEDRSMRRKSDGQIKAVVGSEWLKVVKDEPNNARVSEQ